MGVFKRPDSPYWWLYLPTAPRGQRKQKTKILVGTTNTERRDNKLLAQQVYAQRMTEIAKGLHGLPHAKPTITFSAYAVIYARDVLAHRRGKARALELLKALDTTFGPRPLAAIDPDAVRAYMTRRRETCAPRTVNAEVALLHGLLRSAVPTYLEAPLVGVKYLPTETPRRRLLHPAEEQRLLAVGEPEDRALLLLGLDALMRLGDVLNLQRADVRGVWATVRAPKGGRPYEVPLTKRTVQALAAIPGKEPYYFARFRRATSPRDWGCGVRSRLRRLCALCDPPIPYGRKQGGFTFHWGTRRTGATRYLVQQRQPVTVVQRLGNWKQSSVLLEIYAEAQRGDLLAAVGQVPNRSRSGRKPPKTGRK